MFIIWDSDLNLKFKSYLYWFKNSLLILNTYFFPQMKGLVTVDAGGYDILRPGGGLNPHISYVGGSRPGRYYGHGRGNGGRGYGGRGYGSG